jgi:hypothetical protein
VGKGTLKAYEKGEWCGNAIGEWGALIYYITPIINFQNLYGAVRLVVMIWGILKIGGYFNIAVRN